MSRDKEREILEDMCVKIKRREYEYRGNVNTRYTFLRQPLIDQALSKLKALDNQRCENCKEEKLNVVAEHFKRYNKALSRIDETKLTEKIKTSKIVTYAKKLGRNLAKAQRIQYDDPKDVWLNAKAIELAHEIAINKEILKYGTE